MSVLGKNIRLRGISQKGKNRIREHGETWSVLAVTDHVLFSPGKPGPWWFITPEGASHDSKATRWIHSVNDADFTLIAEGD